MNLGKAGRLSRDQNRWFILVLAPIAGLAILVLAFFLMEFLASSSGNTLAVSLRSALLANYNADPFQLAMPALNLNILQSALNDESTHPDRESRLPTTLSELLTPVPSVTPNLTPPGLAMTATQAQVVRTRTGTPAASIVPSVVGQATVTETATLLPGVTLSATRTATVTPTLHPTNLTTTPRDTGTLYPTRTASSTSTLLPSVTLSLTPTQPGNPTSSLTSTLPPTLTQTPTPTVLSTPTHTSTHPPPTPTWTVPPSTSTPTPTRTPTPYGYPPPQTSTPTAGYP
jgi:hypothetical protein